MLNNIIYMTTDKTVLLFMMTPFIIYLFDAIQFIHIGEKIKNNNND